MDVQNKSRQTASLRREAWGPLAIAIGIATLLAAAYWPVMPVVSGMSLVALGATLAVVSRFAQVRRHRPLVFVHAVVYASLYVLFVGSVCHGTTAAGQPGLSLLRGIDLLASGVPMALAARLVVSSLTRGAARAAR
jgi:hypothetical protein